MNIPNPHPPTDVAYWEEECRRVAARRDAAKTYEERQYHARMLDAAVQDLLTVRSPRAELHAGLVGIFLALALVAIVGVFAWWSIA